MNSATLGITAIVAVVVGALGALALSDLFAPKYGIILRATNNDINEDHWTKIQAVLDRDPPVHEHADRKMLYRIRTFDQGAIVGGEHPGELAEAQLLEDPKIVELETAKFSGHAFQIGVGASERSKRIPKSQLDTSHAHLRLNISESKEMVKEVDAVLNQ
jgi:hypothetical protein